MTNPNHMMAIYAATIATSDYPTDIEGQKVHVARCSCGWSRVRQTRDAIADHVARHRTQAGAA